MSYADRPQVAVAGLVDNLAVDYGSDSVWAGHVAPMRKAVAAGAHAAVPVDAAFTSDPYGAELACRFSAADVRLDTAREALRSPVPLPSDPVGRCDASEPPVRAWFTRRWWCSAPSPPAPPRSPARQPGPLGWLQPTRAVVARGQGEAS